MSENETTAMDYSAHRDTYRGFIFLTKWGTISVAVVMILMAVFLL